jgi:hypothetical protein
MIVQHLGKSGGVAARTYIGAAAGAGRADNGKGRMSEEVATMAVQPIELLSSASSMGG